MIIPLVLRGYQQEAVDKTFDHIGTGSRRIVLCIPTRGGKTLIATEIAKPHLEDGKRVAFVTPRKSLIEQTTRAFKRQGLTDLGVIQADHPDTNPGAPLQICMAQTLISRHLRPRADIVFIDQCHWQPRFTVEWMSDPEWHDIPFVTCPAFAWKSGLVISLMQT
jgi:superfamily II DNA or RNA helicase